ncbi:MAG: type II toxin-antitoxin system PemK/MazF family toxin [Rhizomicrobium sp.]
MAISEFAAFDVVVVPFPYTDRQTEKRRPAVVISAPALQARYGLVWLMMITSADNPPWDCDMAVSDLTAAGLPAPSVIRPAKIATVDASRILRRAGHLPERDIAAVKKMLVTLTG